MKAVVANFNQEKALVEAFSVIVQLCRLIVYTALPEEQEWVVVRAGRSEDERNLSIPSPFLCSTGNLFFTLQSWLGHRPLSRNPDLVRRLVS